MLSSKNRIQKEYFKALTVKGRSFSSASFSAKIFFDEKTLAPMFSVVVAKKLEKSAVKRNGMKRRVYSLLRPYAKTGKKGLQCVIFLKKKVSKENLESLTLEIANLFERANFAETRSV